MRGSTARASALRQGQSGRLLPLPLPPLPPPPVPPPPPVLLVPKGEESALVERGAPLLPSPLLLSSPAAQG